MKTTTTVLKGSHVERTWYLIDLKGKTLGRVCTEMAQILMGKSKPTQPTLKGLCNLMQS